MNCQLKGKMHNIRKKVENWGKKSPDASACLALLLTPPDAHKLPPQAPDRDEQRTGVVWGM